MTNTVTLPAPVLAWLLDQAGANDPDEKSAELLDRIEDGLDLAEGPAGELLDLAESALATSPIDAAGVLSSLRWERQRLLFIRQAARDLVDGRVGPADRRVELAWLDKLLEELLTTI